MSKKEDITGLRFERLVVLREGPYRKNTTQWVCRCDCGSERTVAARNLKNGHTKSCGCLALEVRASKPVTHGMCGTPERTAWSLMRGRCKNPNNKKYKDYGARGISVCERWDKSFKSFFDDMGPRPSPNHSIDRIDVNGNYEPSNCRWATVIEQARNKRPQARSASGVSGVIKTPDGWRVTIGANGKRISLGSYRDIADAISARRRGEVEYWGYIPSE